MTGLQSLIVILALVLSIQVSLAFSPLLQSNSPTIPTVLQVGYVPNGLTPEEYKNIKARDRKKLGKDLGRLGPQGFKSRSMQAWQEAYEQGEVGHYFAPLDYRSKLKQGKLRKEDVPYMVRGGNWDNSDVAGARRLRWFKTDKDYSKGGYKKEQSVSILGSGPGLNWSGAKRDFSKETKRSLPGFS